MVYGKGTARRGRCWDENRGAKRGLLYTGNVINETLENVYVNQIIAFLHVSRLKFIIGYLGKSINFVATLRFRLPPPVFRIPFSGMTRGHNPFLAAPLTIPRIFAAGGYFATSPQKIPYFRDQPPGCCESQLPRLSV